MMYSNDNKQGYYMWRVPRRQPQARCTRSTSRATTSPVCPNTDNVVNNEAPPDEQRPRRRRATSSGGHSYELRSTPGADIIFPDGISFHAETVHIDGGTIEPLKSAQAVQGTSSRSAS